jgi:hypothetical protein
MSQPRERLGGWTAFLNSLATSGGNLFLLAFFSLVMMAVTALAMIKYGPTAPVVTTISGSFMAFTGAMIGILRGSKETDPVAANTMRATSTTVSTNPPPPPAPTTPLIPTPSVEAPKVAPKL